MPSTISLVLILSFIVMVASLHAASATTFTAVQSGSWQDNSTWDQNPSTTIKQGDTVIIPQGISVSSPDSIAGSVAIENFGIIDSSGVFQVNGILANSGTINIMDNGMLENISTVNNINGGTINNNGTIYNVKTINNAGNPPDKNSTINNFGTINNQGSFNNEDGIVINDKTGTILNNNLGRPIQDPQGVINNYGIAILNYGMIVNNVNAVIQNVGPITNYCGGTVENSGTIMFNPVVDMPCDSTPPSIIAPQDVSKISNVPVAVSLGTPIVHDDYDPSPIVTNNSTGLFQVGVTVVIWTATDHSGNSATVMQKVSILTPSQAVENLILLAHNMEVSSNPLKEASKLLEDKNLHNNKAVIGKIEAFVKQVQDGKTITNQQAARLIDDAQNIQNAIS